MSTAALSPQLWEAAFLTPFFKAHVFGQPAIATRVYEEGEILRYGQSIKIPTMAVPTSISDYDPTVGLTTPDALSAATQELTVSNAKAWNFLAGSIETVQAKPELMPEALKLYAYALADQVDQALVAALVDDGSAFDGGTVEITDFVKARELISDLNAQLSRANVPAEGRYAVVDPTFLSMIEKSFTAPFGLGQDVMRNGFMGRLYNVDIYVSNNLPAGTIVSGGQGAFALVEQLNSIEAYTHPSFFGDAVRGLLLYGYKVVRPSAVVVATWTDASGS